MMSRSQPQASKPSVVSHQTIKLSRGKHASPEQGACVMELASMLAGESFTDHPASVCPVIGSFLRAYNDSIDTERRQDLYAYASKLVGSRAHEEVRLERAERLATWAFELRQERRLRIFRRLHERRGVRDMPAITSIGRHAVTAIKKHTDQTHASVLALVDDLLQMGPPRPSSRVTEFQPRQAVANG
jgi:hypothetical protein